MTTRRYTRKLPKRGGATYRETQVAQLCGKHAFDHILQEEKFIWDAKTRNIYIGGTDPKDKNTKINLYGACKSYEKILKEEYVLQTLDTDVERILNRFHDRTLPPTPEDLPKMYERSKEEFAKYVDTFNKETKRIKSTYAGMTDDEIHEEYKNELLAESKKPGFTAPMRSCTYTKDGKGNVEIDLLHRWGNILGLKGILTSSAEVDTYPDYVNNMISIIYDQIEDPVFLGVIMGKGGDVGGHYTSVVMYDDVCEPARRSGTLPKTYAYIDSLKVEPDTCMLTSGKECSTKDELAAIIKEFDPVGMVFLYGYDNDDEGPLNPYQSVAYTRMKAAAGAAVAAAATAATAATAAP